MGIGASDGQIQYGFLLLRSRVLTMYGRWREALAELDAYAATHPDSPYQIDVDFYRARSLRELGKKEEARKIWQDIVKNYPKSELGRTVEGLGFQIMKILSFFLGALFVPCLLAADTEQRIYTAPDPAATGGIKGTVNVVVTHALAVNHDHVEVYRGAMSNGGKTFSFEHLPVGKYDLVLVTNNAQVYEGLALGEEKRDLPAGSTEHLKKRITSQEAFFNRALIQRIGYDGENAFAFVERIRDQKDPDAGRRGARRDAATVRRD